MPVNVVKTQADENKWEKAKKIAHEEKPELDGDDFYKYTMGVYKKMKKNASDEEIIESLYEEGVISRFAKNKFLEEKRASEVINDTLEKSAKMNEDLKNSILTGLVTGGAVLGAGALVGAGAKQYNAIKGALLRGKRLRQIEKFEPSIRDMDPELVKATMKDIERLNPDYAASPLIAGSVLKSVSSWGGLGVDQANLIKDNEKGKSISQLFTEGMKMKVNTGQNALKSPFELKKKASEPEAPKSSFGKQYSDSVRDILTTGAALATGAIAATAGVGLAKKISNSVTRSHRLNRIKAEYPELQKIDDKNLTNSLKAMEKVNPVFASDPLIAGGYIKKFVQNKGIKPEVAQGLADAAGNVHNYRPFMSAKMIFGKSSE